MGSSDLVRVRVRDKANVARHAQSKCPLGSAPARLLRLLRARLAAPGSSAFPIRGQPTERPATASGARASRLQSRRFHGLCGTVQAREARQARARAAGRRRARGGAAAARVQPARARQRRVGLRCARAPLHVRNRAGAAFGQLALRRLLSAPEHAPGCPELRPASATQPVGRCLPATPGLLSTQAPVWLPARRARPPCKGQAAPVHAAGARRDAKPRPNPNPIPSPSLNPNPSPSPSPDPNPNPDRRSSPRRR